MRRLFAIIVAAIAFIGCSMDNITVSYQTDKSDIYYASFEEFGEELRTYVDEDVKLLWHEDDRISLFRTTLNEQFKFTGATGDNSGGFALIESDEYVTGNVVSTNYAVYPYDATTKLSNDEIIQLTMPAVQHYAENSFGRGANTMVAASENTSSKFLPFRNLGGYIIVKLYGEDTTIKSIEFKGNNEEVIAGAATAEAKYGYLPVVTMLESGTTTITLDCGEAGVTISSDSANPTSFWFVVPPITFEGGFTFTITDINGNTFTKSTTKKQTVVRNEVKSMSGFEPTFEGEGEDPEVAPKPANNEIWYTNGSTTQKSLPNYIRFGGATIVSNSYDASKECWVITFSGEVTEIGNSVFKDCSSLASVTIPDSVTEIGDYAFQYCSNLSSVTIGNSVNSIGMYAFFECSSLSSVTIPNSVTEIKGHAFAYCSSLSSVTIGDSVTSIGYAAFNDCSNLLSVTIPDSVTEIGDYAFQYCSNLSSATIGNSANSIGVYAFNRCSSLAEFKGKYASEDGRCLIVNGVLYSFAPAGLTAYTIPDSVTEIGDTAFRDCSNLSSVTIPDSVTDIGDEAFDLCSNLSSVTIPDSVISIGDTAFGRCSSLSSITIPNSVTEIGGYAFFECSSLSSITIPDCVTSIANCTFYNCLSLLSVTIPDSVTSIGHAAFYGCKSLTSVYCKPTTPPTGSSVMFSFNAPGPKIYVPNMSVEAYRSASNWSEYASYIVGYDFYEAVDMGLSVKWAATNVGADSPEELGNLYAWGEVTPKAEYYTSNYAWWTYEYGEDGDGWWSTTSIKKYGSSYSNSDYIWWDGYYDNYYWVNDGLTVLDLEDDAARTEWGGSWRMPTQAECQELVDNCTIEKVTYNNCDGFLFTSTKAGYTDKKLFFPLTPSKQLDDETTYAEFYSGLFWSSTQYLPFPACAYVFRSRYPYTSCTLGPITRYAGFPVRPVKQ
ncbi:MAG: leucine-rich repeat domain-containing protein [Alistipes sp.]|nr:leucine-rich repeat domain-containing protein [Alistipes sp.]